jgi:hypothetical protein
MSPAMYVPWGKSKSLVITGILVTLSDMSNSYIEFLPRINLSLFFDAIPFEYVSPVYVDPVVVYLIVLL